MNGKEEAAFGKSADGWRCRYCDRDAGSNDKVCPGCGRPAVTEAAPVSDTYWETAPLESDLHEEHTSRRKRHRHLES